jgi:hypothetical protein
MTKQCCTGDCKGHPHHCFNHPTDCGCTDAAAPSNHKLGAPYLCIGGSMYYADPAPNDGTTLFVLAEDFETLRQERDRLREALEKIANTFCGSAFSNSCPIMDEFCIKVARAALAPESGGKP